MVARRFDNSHGDDNGDGKFLKPLIDTITVPS